MPYCLAGAAGVFMTSAVVHSTAATLAAPVPQSSSSPHAASPVGPEVDASSFVIGRDFIIRYWEGDPSVMIF